MIKCNMKVGGQSLQIEGSDIKELCKEAELLSELASRKCDCCESVNFSFGYRNINNNEYYFVKCSSCKAELKMGIGKATQDLFLRSDAKFIKFTRNENG